MSIYDPRNIPNTDSLVPDILTRTDCEAEAIDGEEYTKKALSSIHNGKPFTSDFLIIQNENMKSQLKELVTNTMLVSMFLNLNTAKKIIVSLTQSTCVILPANEIINKSHKDTDN